MSRSFDEVVAIERETLLKITSNPKLFMNFLVTASNNYKYPFDDQLLIYAQRPDATACANMPTWNRIGRRVNKGAVGIALLGHVGAARPVRYVFDVSDTTSQIGRSLWLWRLDEKREAAVAAALDVESSKDPAASLLAAVFNNVTAAIDVLTPDYLKELTNFDAGSTIGGTDDATKAAHFTTILRNAVAYAVLQRCGAKVDDIYTVSDFSYIKEFNTPETAMFIGNAISETSQGILRSVEAVAKNYERNLLANLVKPENKVYDADKEKEQGGSENDGKEQDDRNAERTGDAREVRENAPTLSEREQEGNVLVSSDERRAGSASDGDRRDRDEDGKPDRPKDGGAGRYGREAEGAGSDGLGRADEQLPAQRGGNRPSGSDLQLIDLEAAIFSQTKHYYHDEEKQELIRDCAELREHRAEIAAYFDAHEDDKERGDFIRSFFSTDKDASVELSNGQLAGYHPYKNALHLWRGAVGQATHGAFLRWNGVASTIYGMMLTRKWLAPDEYSPATNAQQLSLIEAASVSDAAFNLPQEAIDYVLRNGPYNRIRTYDFFCQKHTNEENAAYLKKEAGIGGRTDAIPGTGYYEDHNGKGITIKAQYGSDTQQVTITWEKTAKRIGELIATDRFLSAKDKEEYPKYLKEREYHDIRVKISYDFRAVVNEYKAAIDGTEKQDLTRDLYSLSSMSTAFALGNKVVWDKEKEYILPIMRDTMRIIGDERPDLAPRCNAVLEDMKSEAAAALEPTEAELNPPEPPKMEYRYAEGDTVYINSDEYEVLSITENEITLRDAQYPLFNKAMSRTEFIEVLSKDQKNDALLVEATEESTEEPVGNEEQDADEDQFAKAQQLVQDFCRTEYDEEADFTDLCRVSLAHSSTKDDSKEIQITADLLNYKIVYEVAGELVKSIDCADQKELNDYLATLNFDAMVADAEDYYDEFHAVATKNAADAEHDATDLAPNVPHYLALKEDHPGKLVGVMVGKYTLFYGGDAIVAAQALGTNVISREIEGMGKTTVTGMTQAWQATIKKLLEHGASAVLAKPNDEIVDAAYEIITDRDASEYIPVGMELPVEGRRMKIESVDFEAGKVSLKELDVEGANPISRSESIPVVRSFIEEYYDTDEYAQKLSEELREASPTPVLTENKTEPATVRARPKTASHVLHPEIPSEQRYEYRIADDRLGVGTPSERYEHNVAAIKTLKHIESEDRLATPEEQEVLAQYVGWGGLADYFDESNKHYDELKELLSEQEYNAARESTLTAFYTPPTVIRAIYNALDNMGFHRGNILEPSCGIGNFIGMKPSALADSKIYGIELDSISGRIAQQLYQNSSIAVQGYEKTELPDSFFDAALGNVPFGDFKVNDRRYNKNNFRIHDYFFAKSLDKVRPGGVIAFVTSKGTLDKENSAVRKYIAERADLLGAIRLPNNTFKSAAGTEVTSDIIFLQKRDTMTTAEPEWIYLGKREDGLVTNQYFIDHPDMILGELREVSGPFGPETACLPKEDTDLDALLTAAVANIRGQYSEMVIDDPETGELQDTIPADPEVRNFSYTLADGKLYYRQDSVMTLVNTNAKAEERIRGMIELRDCVRSVIELQTEDYPDAAIRAQQKELNRIYDSFVSKNGRINARGNVQAFGADSSFFLLSSLEKYDDDGNYIGKADMFSKRTIKQRVEISHVDTAEEALVLSLSEKAKIDMEYMEELTEKTGGELFADLKGSIFLNPMYGYGNAREEKYLTSDEYLSGNVREKLNWAKRSAELNPEDYAANVQALESVQPKDLTAAEISVRLGATWLPESDVEEFMFHLFETNYWSQKGIHVHFCELTGEWNIEGKTYDRINVKANKTYGTDRINGYKIVEETLNLRDVRINDYVEDENGRKKAVLNKKETVIAQGKQALIKQAFQDWIWSDPDRRERLCKLYNEKFNSTRPREYDGKHLTFSGINPEIKLREHQLNAIAHILYGGNTLLAHVVGAGKTFEMVAAAMESKRLGLCSKSLFVVPNHLTEQWASEFLQLYPAANILVATKKDFEPKNRKRFTAKIATGDYDAIIMGHSQLEKIPMSVERQRDFLQRELDEIVDGIIEMKENKGDKFSIKQLEKLKKDTENKLEKLNDQTNKDDVVTFEELGVDRLFVDEAHNFKNLAAFSKMRNVAGISQSDAKKSSDLYMKCRYLDEITDSRGVVFATGTPVSNTMVELYTMQRYLQYETLKSRNLAYFDAWASTFGETVTAIELAPEGTGYRAKTRFAKFYNLPELMAMFKEVADIQTADMLNLPVPKAVYHNEVLKPSEIQKEMVAALSKRAENVRSGGVDSSTDNMLLITNDGRKLALDQRLMNEMLPDSDTSKVNACAQKVYEIWRDTAANRSAQMVFCDLSTPHNDDKFNVYDDLKTKLTDLGVPAEEVAFIHDAATETKKKEMFAKVRSGKIRVLIGSTFKMGAGTNAQTKLKALHHLDCPWRPADLQQREGRIIRQGNENAEVDIYTYVTEGTFDSYLYQLVEGKQKFIGQIMTSKSPVRAAEDVDEAALSYAEIKALCTGNPYIKEKMDLDIEVARLTLLKTAYLNEKYSLQDQIRKDLPYRIQSLKRAIVDCEADIKAAADNTEPNEDGFSPMTIENKVYTDKKAAGSALLEVCHTVRLEEKTIGSYRGFSISLIFDSFNNGYRLTLHNHQAHRLWLGADIFGNIQRIDNEIESFAKDLEGYRANLSEAERQLEVAKVEVDKPFPQEQELAEKTERLNELNALLDLDHKDNEIVDEAGEDEPGREPPSGGLAERRELEPEDEAELE